MYRLLIISLLAQLFCTSCFGVVIYSGERVDYDEKENCCDFYFYCLSNPDKIKASFGEPKHKYFKNNREYWVYERKTGRGILLGAIVPIPLIFPYRVDTTFEFENGKRISTSTVKDKGLGFLCGAIWGFEHSDWACKSGKYFQ